MGLTELLGLKVPLVMNRGTVGKAGLKRKLQGRSGQPQEQQTDPLTGFSLP